MTTEEVAKKVVDLVRKQAWYDALDTLYDDNIVSVEAFSMGGGSPETRGKEGVRGKIDWWVNATEMHSFTADGGSGGRVGVELFDSGICVFSSVDFVSMD